MSMKRKNSENSSSTCKLLSVDSNSDEEFNYEAGNMGSNVDNDDDEEDDDMSRNDYFKYLEADFHSNNSFLNDTTLLNTNFSNKKLLSKAVPGTRKYQQILCSTPALAAKTLTKNFKVKDFKCVFMEPSTNNLSSFCIKTNVKKN